MKNFGIIHTRRANRTGWPSECWSMRHTLASEFHVGLRTLLGYLNATSTSNACNTVISSTTVAYAEVRAMYNSACTRPRNAAYK